MVKSGSISSADCARVPDERTPRIRVAALVRRGDSILLVRHRKDEEDYWLLPGGGVEFGESLAEALEREVREETGLVVRVGDLILANDSIPPEKSRHIVNLVFDAKEVGGELKSGQDLRLQEAAFRSIDSMDVLVLYPDIRRELRAFLESYSRCNPLYLGNLWCEGR